MNSTDPAFDRAAAHSRSVSRHRNRVAARLSLFQSALSSEPRSSSSGANGAFMGTNDQHSNSSLLRVKRTRTNSQTISSAEHLAGSSTLENLKNIVTGVMRLSSTNAT